MIEFYKENDVFIWRGEAHERFPAKEAGFRYDGLSRTWSTKTIEKAIRLMDYADPDLRAELQAEKDRIEANLNGSRAKDADIEIPVPPGLELRPFQKGGVAFANGKPGVLIADDMGLGKTPQALVIINLDESIKRVLVTCPAALRLNWKREAERWLTRNFNIGIAMGKVWPDDADFIIINYDILTKHETALRAQEWDLIIADEVHYCKNPKAKRTQALFGHADRRTKTGWKTLPVPARRKVALTGTPILNKPIELWPIIQWLDPVTWRSFWYYAKRFCAAYQSRWGWDMTGAAHLDELNHKLRSTIMVRRRKAEVLTELPPKERQVIEMPSDGAAHLVRQEREAWGQYEDSLLARQEEMELAEANEDMDAYEAAVLALKEGIKVAFQEMAKLRHDTAVAKVPAVIDHIDGCLENGEKIVVFAHHRDVLKAFKEHYGDAAVLLWGGMTMEQQQAAVDAFQENPDVKVFLGQIVAAGQGITLTASSHVIFAELDWVPGLVTQAEDRCHRIGQHDSVLVQHMVFEGSLDATMAQTLVEKQHIIDAALDKETGITMEAINIATAPTLRGSVSPGKAELQRIAGGLDQDDIDIIHYALRWVAGMCDGAASEDGRGFNKFDTGLGKRLAAEVELSRMQAALALKLVYKYRGQMVPQLVADLDAIRAKTRKEKK